MKYMIVALLLAGGFVATSSRDASAFACARGVYRAGCVSTAGAGAAVVVAPVRRPVVVAPVRRRVY